MIILHTSDWHLGRTLYGKKRTDEHSCFLDWLLKVISRQKVDVLCVSGDIFDSTTPSNKAQSLYYQFLQKATLSGCRHVIITAGNHDSPTLLEAPKDILRSLQVHVVGNITNSLEDEIITLFDQDGRAELLVCAVPYLRDRDIRHSRAGEQWQDKEQRLRQGIENHYRDVTELATKKRDCFNHHVPVIALGHLFAAGGKTVEGDGVRDLYIGSLAHVRGDIFPDCLDYVALGHLHSAQRVGGSETIRYSGSPLPMSFNEAVKEKHIILVELADTVKTITPIPVPCFQKLISVNGDFDQISVALHGLLAEPNTAWLEIIYSGDEVVGNLREQLLAICQGSHLEILRIVNTTVIKNVLQAHSINENLEDLSVYQVFERCMQQNEITGEQKEELAARFYSVVTELTEADSNAY